MDARGAAKTIVRAFKNGKKLLIIGNGGSAAEAQHMAAELVGKYKYHRQALPAIALTTDTSILTALSNDFCFDYVFVRQLEALAKEGDVLLCLSTSGNSNNVLLAIQSAEELGITVIDVPREGKDTPQIQENQLKFIHKVCGLVEKQFI